MSLPNIWSPARNHLYAQRVRLAIKTLLLVSPRQRAQRKEIGMKASFDSLPDEIVTLICQFVAGKTQTIAMCSEMGKLETFVFDGVTLNPSVSQYSNITNVIVPDDFTVNMIFKRGDEVYAAGQRFRESKFYLSVLAYSLKTRDVPHQSYESTLEYGYTCVGRINDLIYFCGGKGTGAESPILSTCEGFDVSTKEWFHVPNLNIGRASAECVTVGNDMYVTGGAIDDQGHKVSDTTLLYGPRIGEWKMLASMKYPRLYHSVASLNGDIYACGGLTAMTGTSTCERYSITENKWEVISSMHFHRHLFLLLVTDGKLIAIGGAINESSSSLSVEMYDPATNKWSILPKYLNLPCSNLVGFTF